jgi:hypothetical protein
MLDDDAPRTRATQAFNGALALLIVANVAAVILESVESIHIHYAGLFVSCRRCSASSAPAICACCDFSACSECSS